jgi:RNA polymerase sigma-70 factor (ECF subfamily)
LGEDALDTRIALDRFLADVERRAYRMAQIATGQREEALDIVQDAMMKLVQNYSQRDQEEWGALFHTILQSTIRDWYRRQKVRNQWRSWLGLKTALKQTGDGQENKSYAEDGLDSATHSLTQAATQEPHHHIDSEQSITALEIALHELPLRQQQAFMLRVWEGLNVDQTANAMQCSQGSVKTHLSRALQSLRHQLEEYQ